MNVVTGFDVLLLCASSFLSDSKRCVTYVNAERGEGVSRRFVIAKLEEFAPTSFAKYWDEVGLVLKPAYAPPITKILLTHDLTADVLNEALSISANLIVSYHSPVTPAALKRLSSTRLGEAKKWKDKIVSKCLSENISVYTPHTAWDMVQGGVNDWLTSAFECSEVSAVAPRRVSVENATSTNADVKPKNSIYDDKLIGMGRLCKLSTPMSVLDAVDRLKEHLGTSFLQLALARNVKRHDLVRTIAFVHGSGGSLLKNTSVVCDLKVVGEACHHDVLDAIHNGASVVITHHSNSLKTFLLKFKDILASMLKNPSVQIVVASSDTSPLQTV